jgi:hypothetical protein
MADRQSPSVGGYGAQEDLRRELADDLLKFLASDVHIAGYIVAWLQRELKIEQLERLVDELDSVYRPRGKSILGRRPS